MFIIIFKNQTPHAETFDSHGTTKACVIRDLPSTYGIVDRSLSNFRGVPLAKGIIILGEGQKSRGAVISVPRCKGRKRDGERLEESSSTVRVQHSSHRSDVRVAGRAIKWSWISVFLLFAKVSYRVIWPRSGPGVQP